LGNVTSETGEQSEQMLLYFLRGLDVTLPTYQPQLITRQPIKQENTSKKKGGEERRRARIKGKGYLETETIVSFSSFYPGLLLITRSLRIQFNTIFTVH